MRVKKGLIVENFPGRTWGDIWYNIKLSFKSFKALFWHIWWFRPRHHSSTMELLLKSLMLQAEVVKDEDSRVSLNRCIELLNNILEDNYSERCGYDFDFEFLFPESLDHPGYYEMSTNSTPEQDAHNDIVRKQAKQLEEDERKEFFDTMRDNYQKWWH